MHLPTCFSPPPPLPPCVPFHFLLASRWPPQINLRLPPPSPPPQIDFNLLGMGHLELSHALFRDPLPAQPPSAPGAPPPPAPGTPRPGPAARCDGGGGGEDCWSAEGAIVPASQLGPGSQPPGGSAAAGSQPPPRVLWTEHSTPADWTWVGACAAPGSQLPR